MIRLPSAVARDVILADALNTDPLARIREADGADLWFAMSDAITPEDRLDEAVAEASRGVPSACYLGQNVGTLAQALHNALVLIRRQQQRIVRLERTVNDVARRDAA